MSPFKDMLICVDVGHKDTWPLEVLAPVYQTRMVACGLVGSKRTFPSRARVCTKIAIGTSFASMMVTEKRRKRMFGQTYGGPLNEKW